MDVLSELATTLGIRTEQPNVALAAKIAAASDSDAVLQLVDLFSGKDKQIAADCIKTLYEIGYINPELIAPHHAMFVALLGSKNNRMQWGAMTALHMITPLQPAIIYQQLPQLMAITEKGTVITRDHMMGILVALMHFPEYYADAFQRYLSQLQTSPTNQFPSYAEKGLPVIQAADKPVFLATLQTRLPEMAVESKRKRVEGVIRKMGR